MIGTAVTQVLDGLKLRYPPGSPELANIRIE
jgi:pantoate kinase